MITVTVNQKMTPTHAMLEWHFKLLKQKWNNFFTIYPFTVLT